MLRDDLKTEIGKRIDEMVDTNREMTEKDLESLTDNLDVDGIIEQVDAVEDEAAG